MLIQLVNILSGFLLASPKLKTWAGKHVAHVEKAESKLTTFRESIGILALIVGVVALLERLGIIFGMFLFGASFPQAIPAILSGLLLAPRVARKFSVIADFTAKLEPYAQWIGVLGIAVGLGSLLFGCVPPICYAVRYF